METGVLSMTLVMLAVIIVPFTIIKLGIKKKEKQGYIKLKEIATKNHHQISDYDIHGNFAIGWDANTKYLYYYKKSTLTELFDDFDLNTIKDCKIVKQTRNVKNGKGSYEVLDKMMISFTPSTIKQIDLYDGEESFQLTGELEIAEKWNKIIRNAIHK